MKQVKVEKGDLVRARFGRHKAIGIVLRDLREDEKTGWLDERTVIVHWTGIGSTPYPKHRELVSGLEIVSKAK